MAILINISKDLKLLEVIYTFEPVTEEDLKDQRDVVAQKISEHKLKKVIIDASALKNFPSPFAVYDHNEEVAALEIFRCVKFAVICSSIGENEAFLETSGRNRGVQIKCVASKSDALRWLNNG